MVSDFMVVQSMAQLSARFRAQHAISLLLCPDRRKIVRVRSACRGTPQRHVLCKTEESLQI